MVGMVSNEVINRVVAQLKLDEGFSPVSFWDDAEGGGGGQWTWGFGTKAPCGGLKINETDALVELRHAVWVAVDGYNALIGDCPRCINDVRRAALINMVYNLGRTRLSKFKRMMAALHEDPIDWNRVADEAMDSLWYRQLSKPGNDREERAERIVRQLRTGEV